MRLMNARLCLDCEEVHEDQHCPVCSSESFAFLTRWVTPSDTVTADSAPRTTRPPDPVGRREQVDAYRQILNPLSTSAETRTACRTWRIGTGPLRSRANGLARGARATRRRVRRQPDPIHRPMPCSRALMQPSA